MVQRLIFSIPFCPWPLYSDCHQGDQLWWWQCTQLSLTKYTELLGSDHAICCQLLLWVRFYGAVGCAWIRCSAHTTIIHFPANSASKNSIETHVCERHAINNCKKTAKSLSIYVQSGWKWMLYLVLPILWASFLLSARVTLLTTNKILVV